MQGFERRPNQGCFWGLCLSFLFLCIALFMTYCCGFPHFFWLSLSLVTGVVSIILRMWVHRRRKKCNRCDKFNIGSAKFCETTKCGNPLS